MSLENIEIYIERAEESITAVKTLRDVFKNLKKWKAVTKTYGQDLSTMSLSTCSIHRSRSQHNHEAAAQAKASFVSAGPLVIHFDGKLLHFIHLYIHIYIYCLKIKRH